MSPRPTSYAAITKHSLKALPNAVTKRRLKLGLSSRETARQIGIDRTTLIRVEAGHSTSINVLVKIFDWLDGPTSNNA